MSTNNPPQGFLTGLWHILGDHRKLMALSILSGLLFSATTLVPPLLVRRLIFWITEGGGSTSGLLTMTAVLGIVYLLRGTGRYFYGRFSHVAAYGVTTDLMARVYRHLQQLSHSFYNRQRTGALIVRSVNDIETLEDFIAHGVPELILATVIPVTMWCVLFWIHPLLALLVVLPLPIGGYVIYRYTREVRRMWRQVRAGISELVAQVQDSFSGITEIKSFGKEKAQAAYVASSAADYRDKICEANKVSLLPSAVVEFSGGVGVIVAVWVGGSLALAGTLNIADLFVFIAYLAYIYLPFLKLADISDTLHRAGASQERIFELLAVQPEISSPPDAITPHIKRWDVAFHNVSFGYQSEEAVLNGIDFEIGAGEMVALVGTTGAGKTTVSRLIPRFYDPQDGQVCIGGHDLRSLDLEFLRANVASVMQDVFLFHGTVRQNIAFGRPDATVDEIVQAAQASNAHEFVVDLPDGYNTIIGERGVLLSGGQKQRISIARALLKDAPILILDEATSSVDTETEWLIQQALNRLTRNRTTLVIAHRLSTIRHADKIVVLDSGRIIETGAHDELMARGGRYAQMVETQSLARSWQLSGQPELQPAGD
ncbi:MAG: ABC transporter ATP-binding protein [Caldilineaceae bacterium SB0661_bin_32]|uniref:ABC transporter ATP-binding protein n=1 Tax=Caldilineaceae bacterium SB0661_bin_32 TaxID=2605255 RepID=A0A6B1DBD6_9CHLR|nr:ABC transporter ATP-binding protein [Caldilineaceae bacterium SB0661_bin_32]